MTGKTTEYILATASPALKGKARRFFRNYLKFAVVEVDRDVLPTGAPRMISLRARGVVRIVSCQTLYVGSTPRSEGYRELHAAKALVASLNADRKL